MKNLYIKDNNLCTPNNITILANDKQYIGVNENTAKSLGFVSLDSLLEHYGWNKVERRQYDIEDVRRSKLSDIENYDTSEAVNSFIINNCTFWLSKADRVGLMHLFNVEKSLGKETTTLWVYNEQFEGIPIDRAIKMLEMLEVYAFECYNVTKKHITEVEALNTIEDIEAYDITKGYPEKLNFNLNEDI